MKPSPPALFLALCLLIPPALLAASCSNSTDSTASEDPAQEDTATEDRGDTRTDSTASEDPAQKDTASEDRGDTRDDRGDSRSDSQNSQGFWQENDNQQSQDQNRATQITAGERHTCALRQTGTITCWGDNRYGQLGNGQAGYDADSSVPVEVQGITDATQITAGSVHTCALRQTGTITCWGNNEQGQLGNGQRGDDADSSVPVGVTGITDATQITTGGEHTCALRQTGTITCWGDNNSGQLGNGQRGDDADSSVPVGVTGITDATQITTRYEHSCALRQTGTITCWGRNSDGQLGNGTTDSSSVPVEVQGITDATQITTGAWYTCALRQTGTIACWGSNKYGQLGNGSEREGGVLVPAEVGGITDATQITAGGAHTCALRQTGTITCWGRNRSGQLGNGTTDSSSVEVQGITDATQITAGGAHTCALLQTGNITCWGYNSWGQLGNGTSGTQGLRVTIPLEVRDITDATQVTAGALYTCALRQTGTITCWGYNWDGQLGNGQATNSSPVPVEVQGITDATQITAGGAHTCALRQTGTIACWGRQDVVAWGWHGDWEPVGVQGITDAIQITTGDSHTCALRQTGTITCWGRNYSGQLGNGTTSSPSSVPVEVEGITDATQITTGHYHTCALLQTGNITCWGNNGTGQLGNGQRGYDSSVPVEVQGITDATQIKAGGAHTCALLQTGNITCWGYNRWGQLGNSRGGENAYSSVPVEVTGITDATQITAGGEFLAAAGEFDGEITGHTCALLQAGTIDCWGANGHGQLGNSRGREGGYAVPVEVQGITDATQITTGGYHSCALRQADTIACWGNNSRGQLGNSDFLPQNVIGFGG